MSPVLSAPSVWEEFERPKIRQDGHGDRWMHLTVQGLSGSKIASLWCSPDDTIYEVKQRLGRFSGPLVGQQQLVRGCNVLQDSQTLASYGIVSQEVHLQYICVKPSGIAEHLEAQRESTNPGQALLASLADVVDSVMQVEHSQSKRHRPSASDVLMAMSARRRAQLITWMAQAFEALQFDDMILHSTVLTLDRYYAGRSTPIEDSLLQTVLLAAVCTELKMASSEDFPPGHWQRVVAHLCQGRVSLAAILRTEREVLCRLGFVVGVPTSLTFLRGLALRLRDATAQAEVAQWLTTAVSLLELSLLDTEIQYGHSHAALAAGALSAALRVCGAPSQRREELLEDLMAYCPGLCRAEDEVAICEEALLKLWIKCADGSSCWSEFYPRLQAKFPHRRHEQISPAMALKQLQQAADGETAAGKAAAADVAVGEVEVAAGEVGGDEAGDVEMAAEEATAGQESRPIAEDRIAMELGIAESQWEEQARQKTSSRQARSTVLADVTNQARTERLASAFCNRSARDTLTEATALGVPLAVAAGGA